MEILSLKKASTACRNGPLTSRIVLYIPVTNTKVVLISLNNDLSRAEIPNGYNFEVKADVLSQFHRLQVVPTGDKSLSNGLVAMTFLF